MERFWSSERTSYALEMRLKVSSAPGSLLTSGWNLRAFCLHREKTPLSAGPARTTALQPTAQHPPVRRFYGLLVCVPRHAKRVVKISLCTHHLPRAALPPLRRAAAARSSLRNQQPGPSPPLIKLPWHTGAQQARIPARAACRVTHSYCSLTNADGLAELQTAALLAAATCCSAGAPQLEGCWHPARGCLAAGPCLCKACSSSPCWEVLVRMPATPWKQAVTTHMHAQPDTATLLLRLQLHLERSCWTLRKITYTSLNGKLDLLESTQHASCSQKPSTQPAYALTSSKWQRN